MKRIVRKTLTDHKLTPKRKRELSKLAGRSDGEIDYSDIPPLSREVLAERGA